MSSRKAPFSLSRREFVRKTSSLVAVGTGTAWVREVLSAPVDSPRQVGAAPKDSPSMAGEVVRSFDFKSPSELGDTSANGYLANVGCTKGNMGAGLPVIDSQGMRFDIPSNNGANPSGAWFANFTSDYSLFFDADCAFAIEVETKWSGGLLTANFRDISSPGAPQGGIKLFDVTAGDIRGGPNMQRRDGRTHYYSSSDAKVVVQTYYQKGFPIVYRYWDASDSGLYEGPTPAGQLLLENQVQGCTYPQVHTDSETCFFIQPDTWMRWRLEITHGPRGTALFRSYGIQAPAWLDSTVKLFGAVSGQPLRILVDWNPKTLGYAPLWMGNDGGTQTGKVWLFPYMTNCAPQPHPLWSVWYRNLKIIKISGGSQR